MIMREIALYHVFVDDSFMGVNMMGKGEKEKIGHRRITAKANLD